jgi:hypothetical protein
MNPYSIFILPKGGVVEKRSKRAKHLHDFCRKEIFGIFLASLSISLATSILGHHLFRGQGNDVISMVMNNVISIFFPLDIETTSFFFDQLPYLIVHTMYDCSYALPLADPSEKLTPLRTLDRKISPRMAYWAL